MASSYPGSLDAFDSIASDKKTSDVVGGRTHRDMHNDLGDAIEAVQAELGTDPAGAFATVKARLDALVAYAAKTGAYTATAADHTLNVTSGTFTLDLPAASTVTGQSLKVKNSGTGVVTLDGNSSETVEGIATYPLGPGSFVEITSTGAAWILTGGTPNTGWRDVSSLLTADATTKFQTWQTVKMRRVGQRVSFLMIADVGTGSAAGTSATVTPVTLPTGFRANTFTSAGTVSRQYANKVANFTFVSYIAAPYLLPVASAWDAAGGVNGELTWHTPDAWPTSLPGTAA